MDKLNLGLFADCCYHDGYIYNYKKDGKNIYFELQENWGTDVFKINLKNVNISIMNCENEVNCYVMDILNAFKNGSKIWLDNGEIGILDEPINGCKYYLKLWIHNRIDEYYKKGEFEYKFDGFDVSFCDDYDDTGCIFIKFIFEDIDVGLLHPLVPLYDRMDEINIENIYKYKEYLEKTVFKFFSAMNLDTYIFDKIECNNNDIQIDFKNKIEPYDYIKIIFCDVIIDDTNKYELDKFIELMNKVSLDCDRIRFIEYKDNEYYIGFMKKLDEEIIFKCKSIDYDGAILDIRNVLED